MPALVAACPRSAVSPICNRQGLRRRPGIHSSHPQNVNVARCTAAGTPLITAGPFVHRSATNPLQLKARQHLGRFHFFHRTFRPFEVIDLLHHLVRVRRPHTAALLDELVDDSSQFFFFSIIEHTFWRARLMPPNARDSFYQPTACSKSLSEIPTAPGTRHETSACDRRPVVARKNALWPGPSKRRVIFR